MKQNLLLILFLFLGIGTYSQGIRGTITDISGEPIPFANIYISELKTGTTTNLDGNYQLQLPPGNWHITFQYIGYTTEEREISTTNEYQEINLQLKPRNYQLKEVKVLASGEDPAYYVMRKAIALGQYYQNQLSQYDCQVYLKGSGKMTKIPWLFKKTMEKEGWKKDKTFVTENITDIHFELPNKLEQKVLSIRSSGDDNDTNPLELITVTLYNTREEGLISPLDQSAFSVYRYQLESVFEDQGRMINHIKVIPKRKGKDLFWGYIDIAENYWNIHSADLNLRMPMTDIHMRQVHAPVEENVWMPVSFDFNIDFEGMGFGMKYLYVAAIKDYRITLNPDLDHEFLQQQHQFDIEEQQALQKAEKKMITPDPNLTPKEKKRQEEIRKLTEKDDLNLRDVHRLQRLMEDESKKNRPKETLEIKRQYASVVKGAKDKDSTYWQQVRPIPLTPNEQLSFQQKDSVVKRLDSLNKDDNKFQLPDIILGNTYKLKAPNRDARLSIPSFVNPTMLSFNTVDGFAYRLPYRFTCSDTLGHYLGIYSELRYAFAREHLDYDLAINYRYNGIKRAWLSLEGGRTTKDFNESRGIDPFLNSITTLFLEGQSLESLWERLPETFAQK